VSLRQEDEIIMRELAEQRRRERAELRAYRLRIAAQYIAEGYGSAEVAGRLRLSQGYAAGLIAEVKKGRGS
jgi:hypothetical protein